jgi:hypothetical protein
MCPYKTWNKYLKFWSIGANYVQEVIGYTRWYTTLTSKNYGKHHMYKASTPGQLLYQDKIVSYQDILYMVARK